MIFFKSFSLFGYYGAAAAVTRSHSKREALFLNQHLVDLIKFVFLVCAVGSKAFTRYKSSPEPFQFTGHSAIRTQAYAGALTIAYPATVFQPTRDEATATRIRRGTLD